MAEHHRVFGIVIILHNIIALLTDCPKLLNTNTGYIHTNQDSNQQ